jgi:hypothetical protein
VAVYVTASLTRAGSGDEDNVVVVGVVTAGLDAMAHLPPREVSMSPWSSVPS